MEKFAETFDGAPFQVKEEFSRAKVEFALNQRVPLGVQKKSTLCEVCPKYLRFGDQVTASLPYGL